MKHQQKGNVQFIKAHVMASFSIKTKYVTVTLNNECETRMWNAIIKVDI